MIAEHRRSRLDDPGRIHEKRYLAEKITNRHGVIGITSIHGAWITDLDLACHLDAVAPEFQVNAEGAFDFYHQFQITPVRGQGIPCQNPGTGWYDGRTREEG
jgi:hypothetical protein